MKKLQLSAIKQQVMSCLRANLVEAILGLCFFIMFILRDLLPYSQDASWRYMPFMFPTLFVLTYSCHFLFTGKKTFIYHLSILSLVPLILLSGYLNDFLDTPAYGFTIILTVFLLFGHWKAADNTSFARHCVKLLVNAAFSFVIGLLLIGAVAAIYYSIVYIFDWSTTENFIEYVVHFTFYLFVPLFFCQLQQDGDQDWVTLPKIVQFVLNFILSPGIIIYTVILYIYFLTIAIHWELPKGGVAYMVMAFIIVSMAGRMSQLIVSQRLYDWFFRPFGFIAIPPLILFWIGTLHRVCTYSLTESRVYLLAAGVLMTLYVFFLYSKRLGSYRVMLLISSCVIVLLTYIPGITARSIGIASQTHRLESLAHELSLWDTATGKLKDTKEFAAKDSTQIFMAKELSACYAYLENEQGRAFVRTTYGMNDLKDYATDNYNTRYFNCPDTIVPIEGYSRYLIGSRMKLVDSEDVEVWHNGRLLLKTDFKAHADRYKDMVSQWEEEATDIAPFCLRNDSCLVIIKSITRNADGTFRANDYGDVSVFGKETLRISKGGNK